MRLTYFMIATILALPWTAGCTAKNGEEVHAPGEIAPAAADNTPAADVTPVVETDDSVAGDSVAGDPVADDSVAGDGAVDDTPTAEQYKGLLAEYEAEGGARTFARRFLELAEQNPQDPAAADALLWVVGKRRGKPDTTRALELLIKHHLQSQKLGPACKDIAGSRSMAAGKLLRATLEESPHELVRAQACYYLASLLDLEANLAEQLKNQPELAPRVLQYYGKDYGEFLASLELPDLEKRRVRLYEQMRDTFPDAELEGETLGEFAEKMLFQIQYLSVGKVAPEIEGEDIAGNTFKLSDYRGKVVMLTFWGHW